MPSNKIGYIMHYRGIFLFAGAMLLLYFMLTLFWIIRYPPDTPFNISGNIIYSIEINKDFSLNQIHLLEDPLTTFPYDTYLSSTNPFKKSYKEIQNEISLINLRFPEIEEVGQRILVRAFTDELAPHVAYILSPYRPDSLLLLLEWAEQFKFYAKIDSQNAIAFNAIHGYWLNSIANVLSKFAHQNSRIHNSFKFRYLAEKCSRDNYHISITESKFEKFKKNFLAGNWAHLIGASWHDSSSTLKTSFVLLSILTGSAYLNLIVSILSTFKKRKI